MRRRVLPQVAQPWVAEPTLVVAALGLAAACFPASLLHQFRVGRQDGFQLRGDIVFRDGFAVMGLRPEAVAHLKQVGNEIARVHLGDTTLVEDLPNVLQKGDDFIDLGRVGTRLRPPLPRPSHAVASLADKLCDLAQRIPVVAPAVEQGQWPLNLR